MRGKNDQMDDINQSLDGKWTPLRKMHQKISKSKCKKSLRYVKS